MAGRHLSWTTRRRLAILVLVIALPLYVVVAVTLANWLEARFGRLPLWAELALYIGLGVAWIFPCKPVFIGVGKADPAKQSDTTP
ncbi:DUF2842 domain-containing protein [Thioclava litoralis]|uniref:DUF2842 domain-containing protein n=1 Tax=Thioclava litoralis TaxID=3076557 RepID=A0ABZ1E289_9RHOB|nr:DUF2842 domain-containing protein [Thioclava sp. FTW29]